MATPGKLLLKTSICFFHCFIIYICAAAVPDTCSVSEGGSVVTSALMKSLLSGMDPTVRPKSDCGGPTRISCTYNILSLYRDRINTGIFRLNGFVVLNWTDSRLTWDPAQYGDRKLIQIPWNKIWTTDFVLTNVFQYNEGIHTRIIYNAIVKYTGEVLLNVPATTDSAVTVTKDSEGYDVVTFIQQYAPWTHDNSAVVFQLEQPDMPKAPFYQDSVEEYIYVFGKLSIIERKFPAFENPLSVIYVDWKFRSKVKNPSCSA